MEYAAHIRKAVLAHPAGKPIYTRTITEWLMRECLIPAKEARNLVAINVKRLVDEGVLARFCGGIVYRPERSVFGDVPLDPSNLIADLYIGNDAEIKGYVTGATFLHELGLCTWMPADVEVATNANVRDRKAKLLNVRLVKPRTHVTSGNVAYLQILDAVRDLDRLPVDCDDPLAVIAEHVRENLDFAKLLGVASRYYPTSVVLKLAKLAERMAA